MLCAQQGGYMFCAQQGGLMLYACVCLSAGAEGLEMEQKLGRWRVAGCIMCMYTSGLVWPNSSSCWLLGKFCYAAAGATNHFHSIGSTADLRFSFFLRLQS